MTSERKIAANRLNGRKSRGPKTPAGKARASRNALRHGLAAVTHRNPAFSAQAEQIAKAICGDDSDPLRFVPAVTFAENELWLRCVRAQQVALIERLRDPTAVPLAKGDNWRALIAARHRQTDLAFAEVERINAWFAHAAGKTQPNSTQKQRGKTHIPEWWRSVFRGGKEDDIDALRKALSDPERPGHFEQASAPPEERDECDALCEALPDLVRLARYERRAWSQRKRALREFIEAKSRDNGYDADAIGRDA